MRIKLGLASRKRKDEMDESGGLTFGICSAKIKQSLSKLHPCFTPIRPSSLANIILILY